MLDQTDPKVQLDLPDLSLSPDLSLTSGNQPQAEGRLGADESGFNYVEQNVYPVNGIIGSRPVAGGAYFNMPIDIYHQLFGEKDGAYLKIGASAGAFTKIATTADEIGVSGTEFNLGLQAVSPRIPLYGNCELLFKGNVGLNASQLFQNNDFGKGSSVLNLESDAAGIYLNDVFTLTHKSSGNLAFLVYTNYNITGDGMDAYKNLFSADLNSRFTQWYEARFTLSGMADTKHLMRSSLQLYTKFGKINDGAMKNIYGFSISDNNRVFFNGEFSPQGVGYGSSTVTQAPPPELNFTLNYKAIKEGDNYVTFDLGVNNVIDLDRVGGTVGVGVHIASLKFMGMDWDVNGNAYYTYSRNNIQQAVGPGSSSDTAVITQFTDPDPSGGGNVLMATYNGHSKEFTIDAQSKMSVIMGTTNANGLAGIVFTGDDKDNVPVKITGIQVWDATDTTKAPIPVPLDPTDLNNVLQHYLPNMDSQGNGGLVLPLPLKSESGSFNALNGKNKVVYNIKLDFETDKSDVNTDDPGGNLRSMTIKVIFSEK